jgi:hypothetical protein
MRRRLALALLAAGLASCSSVQQLYETEDADAVPTYRALNGRFPTLAKCVQASFDGEPADDAEVSSAVAGYEVPLAELVQATRARRCHWTYENTPTITQDYPLDYPMRAMKLLSVQARLRFARSDTDGCLADLIALARFGSDLLLDRWTVGKLIGVNAIAGSQYELRDRLIEGRLLPKHFELLERHLAAVLLRYPQPEAWLRDEQWMARPLLEEVRDLGMQEVIRRVGKDSSAPSEPPPVVEQWHRWLQETLRNDIDRAHKVIDRHWDEKLGPFEEDLRKPLNSGAIPLRMAAFHSDSRTMGERMARNMFLIPAGDEAALRDVADLLFILCLPAMEKIISKSARARLFLESNLWACRLELRRLRTGSFPESLEEIGEPPRDPYTGAPLVYRRIHLEEAEGFVLVSAGPKNDAERRVQVLIDVCRMDPRRFEALEGEDGYLCTLSILRKRDSLR